MEMMTSKERMMAALRNEQPDRVPVAPDFSIMIPTKLTGKPYWEVELDPASTSDGAYVNAYASSTPLTMAYINAVKYFHTDGWLYNGTLRYKQKSEIHYSSKIISKSAQSWTVRTVINTPDGDLTQLIEYPKDNPSTITEKAVKNFEDDFRKVRHLFSDVLSCDSSIYEQQKKALGDHGMLCVGIWPPGFQNYIDLMSLDEMTYAYYDYPDLFQELVEMHDRVCIQKAQMAIDAGVESILTGGSGSITLQSPELFYKMSFPTIKTITAMCKEAGVISGIHSCGKERYIVELCANETELSYINPLEMAPMGDCDLAECKKQFGHRIALMGNLHTINVMLQGSVTDVRRESLKAILTAGRDGGFVLSTGDQCGRDTPFENIFEMVKVVKDFGTYPLDIDRIESEIAKLENTAYKMPGTAPRTDSVGIES